MELVELIYSWGVSDSRPHLAGGKCIHSPYYLTMCARLMKETHVEVILSNITMGVFYWKKRVIEAGIREIINTIASYIFQSSFPQGLYRWWQCLSFGSLLHSDRAF